jgi:signal transduction histidine kinase
VNGKPEGAIEVFEDVSLELEIDKMKSEFISLASHQLRTPLTAVSVYTQMLADGYEGKVTPEQRESLDIIMKSVRRMNRLISALLDISKLETGKINVNQTHIDLKDVLHATMQELEQDAFNKDIKIIYDIPGSSFTLSTDALLVGEIFSNLVSNAIKYTPRQGKLRLSLKERKGAYVFCVKDNGYGIPAEFQNKIFRKFSRAANAESVDTSGSGLGLYMAKEIASILGGKLWFKSTENKGTSFYFSLPSPVEANRTLNI